MTAKISIRMLALGISLAALPAWAGSERECASGFKVSSTTEVRLTCQRSSTVADAKRAEKLSRKWLAAAACSGTLVDPQASIAEAGTAGFLVTVRFICETD